MNCAIMRVMKCGAPKDIVGHQIHNRREREHSNSNPDIDPSRTAQNYSLIETQTSSYNELIDKRIKEGYKGSKAIRKDAVRCCEAIFTASPEYMSSMTLEDEMLFFNDCLKFAGERFGKDNIISAEVHKDENNPHLHINFVPLTSDGRLSAKDMLGGRKDMQQLQDDFYEHISKYWGGLSRGSRADLTDTTSPRPRKHIPTPEFKATMDAMREVGELWEQTNNEINELYAEKDELEYQISQKEQELNELYAKKREWTAIIEKYEKNKARTLE